MLSIPHSIMDCNTYILTMKVFVGYCFVPDKDLRGQNVVLLQSTVLPEMLDITVY